MTQETDTFNKTAQSLKMILTELEEIDTNIVFDKNSGIYNLGMAQHYIREMIANLEERYYKCNTCGRIINEHEYINNLANGEGGFCYCEFDIKILNPFVQIKNGD